jgi:hypothetical protein
MRDGLSNHIRLRWYGTGLEAHGQPDCGSIAQENLSFRIADLSLSPHFVACKVPHSADPLRLQPLARLFRTVF